MRVTRPKARKPQKTKAWARPATGLCWMTLPWKRTSQRKVLRRGASEPREKAGSDLAAWITRATLPKRLRKPVREAAMIRRRRIFSGMEGKGMLTFKFSVWGVVRGTLVA